MGMLEGKTAIVTGASRGIGKAIALRFAIEGASVFLAAEGTEAELEQAAEACSREDPPGGDAAWGTFDLARPGAAEQMVKAAEMRLGGVDILVNNAGIRARRLFGEFSPIDFEQVVAVNLRAPFFASQAVLPLMRARGGGRIIIFAVASRTGNSGRLGRRRSQKVKETA